MNGLELSWWMRWGAGVALMLAMGGCAGKVEKCAAQATPLRDVKAAGDVKFEKIVLKDTGPTATVCLMYRADGELARRPVILMLGAIEMGKPPAWGMGLLERGYLLAAFAVEHPPEADPALRPQWLVFDERFAHGYALGASRAAGDVGRVIDYLIGRGDVDEKRIGWVGSSSTGIPALAAVTREKRVAAVVTFVSTGALGEWFETWKSNALWRGKTDQIWTETGKLLEDWDPVKRAGAMWPTAVLMVNGGEDKVVDPATARSFVKAARSAYSADPERLRLVVYEGFGHNLPLDVVQMHVENWFGMYLEPGKSTPMASTQPTTLEESVKGTQLNAADHRGVSGAK